MPPEPAIEASELRVSRGGRDVLHGVSFAVEGGAITGLLGPSGCGKSTLMRSIVGVQIVAGGEVTVLGEAAGSPGLRRRVGYVTQAPSVYGDLSVRENLDFFARVLDAAPGRVDEVIEAVSLGEHMHQVAGSLSGGQRSRVSLGTALLGEPDLLVLDEPTVGLDPIQIQEIRSLITEVAAPRDGERRQTVILSTHILTEVEAICDRVILMNRGVKAVDEKLASLTGGGRSLEEVFTQVTSRDRIPA
jgi:ABC-2 type transport system ATP-binding protein